MESSDARTTERLFNICRRFRLSGDLIRFRLIPQGNINTSWYAELREGSHVGQYLIQKINRHVFPDPAGVMGNIDRITGHLSEKERDPAQHRVLHFHQTAEGTSFIALGEGEAAEYWRVCDFISNSVTFDAGEGGLPVLRSAGKAFGRFTRQLLDFDPALLTETIPHFHDTPFRLRTLMEAVKRDPLGRAKHAENEINIVRENRDFAGTLQRQLDRGELPLRVTHNDTKTNNVLFHRDTLEPLAVIDLDTCMPGLVCHDFGDMIRFAACSVDASDPVRRTLDLERFRACAEGYLSETGDFLTPAELGSLAPGAAVIALELASRFLTDHLTGDPYFRAEYPGHNLVRAKAQLSLFQDMMAKMEEMQAIIPALTSDAQ